jgi:sigma-B regulation protein RsbU (phosphoserine phosphatase)
LAPGDLCVLYTDGVTEAQDAQGALFGQGRLLEAVLASTSASADPARMAHHVQDTLLAAVHGFVGGAPRFDDITLVVLARSH